ncbi:MAG: YlbF family regulator [Lachnospiraceae bacterium]|nr:YlbF family regulator [Lachnospiraceae bacterium]
MYSEQLEAALNALVDQVRESEQCRNYREKFDVVNSDEGAMDCIGRIRELNMKVGQMSEEEYERESENISARMEELCSDSRVSDFILAEVEFSRMYQYITDRIVSLLDE